MTDRELLEMAAKAAGYTIDEFSRTGSAWAWAYPVGAEKDADGDTKGLMKFNPLNDDGDVLRLEITLKLTAIPEHYGGWTIGGKINGKFKLLAFHEDRKRASTTAAAEIGKAK